MSARYRNFQSVDTDALLVLWEKARSAGFERVYPLPDAGARHSIWARYIPSSAEGTIDLDELVVRSAGFSPADIEFAARKASQRALEQSVYESKGASKDSSTTKTEHYLWAIGDTRQTVSDEAIEEFEQDIERLGRL